MFLEPQKLQPYVLGFDRLFDEIQKSFSGENVYGTSFPPYNLFKTKTGYIIELALAGYNKSNIAVELDKKRCLLQITGTTALKDNSDKDDKVLVHGIATRQFKRSFSVAENLEVDDASMKDGILTIELNSVDVEEDKLLSITVN